MLDQTIKETCLTDVAIRSRHNLHSVVTRKLQKYAYLKE